MTDGVDSKTSRVGERDSAMGAQAPERDDFLTIGALLAFARERLPSAQLDWVEGGAESEVTVQRNRAAFDHWALRARVLRDVRHVDCSAVWLEERLELPVIAAPVGLLGHLHVDGARAVGADVEYT